MTALTSARTLYAAMCIGVSIDGLRSPSIRASSKSTTQMSSTFITSY